MSKIRGTTWSGLGTVVDVITVKFHILVESHEREMLIYILENAKM